MIKVSEVKYTAPDDFKSDLQKKVYQALAELDIPFSRVDNEPAVTMEDCVAIDEKLDVKTVKTLFLCNRQKTSFYLFVTEGDKPFVTKDFSHTLGISRVSFAPSELLLDMMQTEVGATTVFSALVDGDNAAQIVIDKAVLKNEFYGCTDGTTTGYMKVKLDDIINKLLPYTKHTPIIIEI